jgi:hypothetical protein
MVHNVLTQHPQLYPPGIMVDTSSAAVVEPSQFDGSDTSLSQSLTCPCTTQPEATEATS